jgi:transposase
MEVLYARCAGLDVHQKTVVACVRIHGPDGRAKTETRTFATDTAALLELSAWLEESGCTHAVMEATGVYWKPVWHVLEEGCALVLANAHYVRNVPGRKTDVSDAAWLADLLAHGLVRASFVPERPTQELRDLTRTRKQLMRQRAQHINRLHKVLEDANLKMGSYITDITGVTGRAILLALIAGETDPVKLALLRNPRLKTPLEELTKALRGKVTKHHRFMLQTHLDQIDAADRSVECLDSQIKSQIEDESTPLVDEVRLLENMPGMSRTSACVVLAEIGADMSRFPSPQHLVSFAGLCPSLNQSAGKSRSSKLKKGSPWLKTVMVNCAWAAARSKNTYARAQFHRLKARRGSKKAVIAVAASMLTAVYFMLRDHAPYRDLGAGYFDQRDHTKIANRLRRRLESLGFSVQMQPAA